jgi:hypothetical protein
MSLFQTLTSCVQNYTQKITTPFTTVFKPPIMRYVIFPLVATSSLITFSANTFFKGVKFMQFVTDKENDQHFSAFTDDPSLILLPAVLASCTAVTIYVFRWPAIKSYLTQPNKPLVLVSSAAPSCSRAAVASTVEWTLKLPGGYFNIPSNVIGNYLSVVAMFVKVLGQGNISRNIATLICMLSLIQWRAFNLTDACHNSEKIAHHIREGSRLDRNALLLALLSTLPNACAALAFTLLNTREGVKNLPYDLNEPFENDVVSLAFTVFCTICTETMIIPTSLYSLYRDNAKPGGADPLWHVLKFWQWLPELATYFRSNFTTPERAFVLSAGMMDAIGAGLNSFVNVAYLLKSKGYAPTSLTTLCLGSLFALSSSRSVFSFSIKSKFDRMYNPQPLLPVSAEIEIASLPRNISLASVTTSESPDSDAAEPVELSITDLLAAHDADFSQSRLAAMTAPLITPLARYSAFSFIQPSSTLPFISRSPTPSLS